MAVILEDAGETGLEPRFNWGAAIAGAVVAAAVTFFLVALGSGIGLSLVSPRTSAAGTKTFLTLGAIYFFAAQAFGFVAGGHVVGRLIGPAIENTREEEFRAGVHGLVTWALAVVVGLAVFAFAASNAAKVTAAPASYWADMLLQPVEHAGASPAADKAEAAEILAADLARPDAANHEALQLLAWRNTGLSEKGADDRVNIVETRMHDDADAARHAIALASLWTALALLFGAVVSVAAAISARWEDDRLSFGWARRN